MIQTAHPGIRCRFPTSDCTIYSRTQFETSPFPFTRYVGVFIWLSNVLVLGIFIPRLLRPQPKALKPRHYVSFVCCFGLVVLCLWVFVDVELFTSSDQIGERLLGLGWIFSSWGQYVARLVGCSRVLGCSASNSGSVKKFCARGLTIRLNWRTWWRERPMSMMVNTGLGGGTWPWPRRMEWVPTSRCEKPGGTWPWRRRKGWSGSPRPGARNGGHRGQYV